MIIEFKEGAIFPNKELKEREEGIKKREMLYQGKQSEVFFDDFLTRLDNNGVRHYQYNADTKSYLGYGTDTVRNKYKAEMQGVNIAKPVTMLFADLLFSEGFDVTDKDEQKNIWLNGNEDIECWLDRVQFQSKCHKAQLGAGQRGNAVVKVYKNEDQAEIEVIPATNWVPLYNEAREKEGDALVYRYKLDKGEYKQITQSNAEGETSILRVTEYYAGKNIYKAFVCDSDKIKMQIEWDENKLGQLPVGTIENGLDRVEETGYNYSMLQVVTNEQSDTSVFGVSDYTDATIEAMRELCIRQTQIARILDKNSDPGMYGPDNKKQYNPNTGEVIVEVTGKYMTVDKEDVIPGYVTFDGNLEANYQMQQQTMNYIYQETGTNAAALAATTEGISVISGAALEKVLMRPLSKVKVKKMLWTPTIKRILMLAYQIEAGQDTLKPLLKWYDGLPKSLKEDTDVLLLQNGGKPIKSQLTSIQEAAGLTEEEAQSELTKIEAEENRQAVTNVVETPVFG